MATRKKTKKKQKKSKATPKKKAPKKLARKKPTAGKKSAKKKAAPKKAPRKTPVAGKRSASSKKTKAARKPARAGDRDLGTAPFASEGLRARSGGQSGDLQGLSNIEGADSESVDELLEEGNAFEADVVKGVEDAGDRGEVHTHEVLEDDVPSEYLDED